MPRGPSSASTLFQPAVIPAEPLQQNAFANPDIKAAFKLSDQALWLTFSGEIIAALSKMFDAKEPFQACYWYAAKQRQKIAVALKHGEEKGHTQLYGLRRCTESQRGMRVNTDYETVIEQFYNDPEKKQAWQTQSAKIFAQLDQVITHVTTEPEHTEPVYDNLYDATQDETFIRKNCRVTKIIPNQTVLETVKEVSSILSRCVDTQAVSDEDLKAFLKLNDTPEAEIKRLLNNPREKERLQTQLKNKKPFDEMKKEINCLEKFPLQYEINISHNGIPLSRSVYLKSEVAPQESQITTHYADLHSRHSEASLFAEAEKLFDEVLKCERGDTQPFLKALGKLSYIMAHFLPVRRGNAGIMYWVQHALAEWVDVKLNGYRHDDTELSWDLKALVTPDIDAYAEWFAQKVFVLGETPEAAPSASPAAN